MAEHMDKGIKAACKIVTTAPITIIIDLSPYLRSISPMIAITSIVVGIEVVIHL